jgi:hypothetical protein
MTDQDFILAPATVKVGFSLSPVNNNINSLMLLSQLEHQSGFGEWVYKTYRRSHQATCVTRCFFGIQHCCEKAATARRFRPISRKSPPDPVVMRDKIV